MRLRAVISAGLLTLSTLSYTGTLQAQNKCSDIMISKEAPITKDKPNSSVDITNFDIDLTKFGLSDTERQIFMSKMENETYRDLVENFKLRINQTIKGFNLYLFITTDIRQNPFEEINLMRTTVTKLVITQLKLLIYLDTQNLTPSLSTKIVSLFQQTAAIVTSYDQTVTEGLVSATQKWSLNAEANRNLDIADFFSSRALFKDSFVDVVKKLNADDKYSLFVKFD